MNKAHQIVVNYLTKYLKESNLDKLTEILAESAPLYRGEKYVLNIDEQINIIKNDINIAVWYLMEFIETYEEEIFYKIFIGTYYDDEENCYTILHIDDLFIKCIYNSCQKTNLILVNPKNCEYGEIDVTWFKEQIKRNFHSNIEEVLQDIKNHITNIRTIQEWQEINT